MASFQYKARNKQGNLIKATIEADSATEVARILMSQEITPITISAYTPDIDPLKQFNQWQDLRSLKLEILFSRQMYTA